MSINTIFPPVIETSMAGFLRTQTCKVYFELPSTVVLSDIKYIQVSVVYPETGKEALDLSEYPANIKITTVKTESTTGRYYIEISPSDLKFNIFELNQYYKVQLRFCTSSCSDFTSSTKINTWLTTNINNFSEWSSACLIRGIASPSISLSAISESSLTDNLIKLYGTITFDEDAEKDFLAKYKVLLYKGTLLLYESNWISAQEYENSINTEIPYYLENGESYTITIQGVTYTGYNFLKNISTTISGTTQESNIATLSFENDIENGRSKIKLHFNQNMSENSTITIYRNNSQTVSKWNKIYQIPAQSFNKDDDFIWYDYTQEAGIWYRYGYQVKNENNFSPLYATDDYELFTLDSAFLVNDEKQLSLLLDFSIDSLSYNIQESLVQTIGSQYPKIMRNGHVKYRTFGITGLICSFMDEDKNVFTNFEDLYGSSIGFSSKYKNYFKNNYGDLTSSSYNYIHEKFFRDKVIDFLQEDKVFLFKSQTEGNMLIKLMNITFTPNQVLGRLIYSFSATAVEVADPSLKNLSDFNIINVNVNEESQSQNISEFWDDYQGALILMGS